MATDSVMGLFQDPQQIQQQQYQQVLDRNISLAKLDPFQRATALIGTGAYQLGGAIGGALGGQDPQLQRATARQQILKNVNPQDMKSIEEAAIQFSRMGDGEGIKAMQDLAFKQSQITKNMREGNAAMLTTEQRNAAGLADSSGAARGTPEWTDTYKTELTRLTTGNKGANIKEIGVAEGTRQPVYFDAGTDTQFVMRPNPQTGKQERVAFNGGVDRTTAKTDVRVDNKAAAAGAVEIAQLDAKRLAQAQAAADKAVEAAGILTQLEKTPQGISGAGADTRLAALRVFDSVGLTSSTDQKALGDADKFNSLTGERTLSFIKQLGTNPTDTDREFAKTIGPSIQKGEKTNKDLIDYLRKRAQETVGSARAMETHFYKNNYSLQGYQSPFASNLEAPSLNKMSAEELAKAAGGKIVNGKFVKN